MEGTAVVHLQFGPEYVKHLRGTLDETGRHISNITEATGSTIETPNSAGGNES
ncbi:MAG: hypothetical protein H6667_08345 [Ardenticatenaceae bacterium]|nr:hypothetical protein [Ardenticatenaceae bacterium]